MGSDGGTTSLWIPGGSDLLDRFDARYGEQQRSAHVREGMELLMTVDGILDDAGYSFDDPESKRAFVRQALYEQIRREAED